MTAAEIVAPQTHGFNGWQLLLVLVLLGVVAWLWAGALAEHRERLDRLADPAPLPEDRWPAGDAGRTTLGEVVTLGVVLAIFLGVVQAIASSKP